MVSLVMAIPNMPMSLPLLILQSREAYQTYGCWVGRLAQN
jgi:hypothetical protein